MESPRNKNGQPIDGDAALDAPNHEELVMHADVQGRGSVDTVEGPSRIRLLLNGEHETIDVSDVITGDDDVDQRNAELLHRTAVNLASSGTPIHEIVDRVQQLVGALVDSEDRY